ncbi:hypothetical protein GR268_46625, partial [Rhizobium leguminosarum]|nr:hypothetical protein [Rhizobium leguminosarum]
MVEPDEVSFPHHFCLHWHDPKVALHVSFTTTTTITFTFIVIIVIIAIAISIIASFVYAPTAKPCAVGLGLRVPVARTRAQGGGRRRTTQAAPLHP